MSSDMIALNNKILKLEGFINDITFSTKGNDLIVSASVAHEKNRRSKENPNSVYTINKSGDNRMIVNAKTDHSALYDDITQSFFQKNSGLTEKIAELKRLQGEKQDTVANRAMMEQHYFAALRMLSDGSMTNEKKQTPKGYMEKQNQNWKYMIPLFKELEEHEAQLNYQPASTQGPSVATKRSVKMLFGISFIGLAICAVLSATANVPSWVSSWLLVSLFAATIGSGAPVAYWMNRPREDDDLPFVFGTHDKSAAGHDDYELEVGSSTPGVYNLYEMKSPVSAAENGAPSDPSKTPSLQN